MNEIVTGNYVVEELQVQILKRWLFGSVFALLGIMKHVVQRNAV